MSLSEPRLRAVLEKEGIECGEARNDAIPIVITIDDEKMVVAVRSDGGIVQFRTLELLHAKAHRHLVPLLAAMMSCNNRYKLTKFAYDPSDGEIAGYVEIVVEDGRLHKSQVRRCIDALELILRCRGRFVQIMDTGHDPGPDDRSAAEETVRKNIDKLLRQSTGFDEPSLPSFVDTDSELWADNTEAKSLSLTFSTMLNIDDRKKL